MPNMQWQKIYIPHFKMEEVKERFDQNKTKQAPNLLYLKLGLMMALSGLQHVWVSLPFQFYRLQQLWPLSGLLHLLPSAFHEENSQLSDIFNTLGSSESQASLSQVHLQSIHKLCGDIWCSYILPRHRGLLFEPRFKHRNSHILPAYKTSTTCIA